MKKRSTTLILLVTVICCLAMALVDGVLRPGYAVKSAIKIALFMLIPLIIPMAQIFGISSQLCIVAFAFGDGFSNVLYPTNPALLISLGLVDVSYGDWFKWSWKFQFMNLIMTSALLLLGLVIGY